MFFMGGNKMISTLESKPFFSYDLNSLKEMMK